MPYKITVNKEQKFVNDIPQEAIYGIVINRPTEWIDGTNRDNLEFINGPLEKIELLHRKLDEFLKKERDALAQGNK